MFFVRVNGVFLSACVGRLGGGQVVVGRGETGIISGFKIQEGRSESM